MNWCNNPRTEQKHRSHQVNWHRKTSHKTQVPSPNSGVTTKNHGEIDLKLFKPWKYLSSKEICLSIWSWRRKFSINISALLSISSSDWLLMVLCSPFEEPESSGSLSSISSQPLNPGLSLKLSWCLLEDAAPIIEARRQRLIISRFSMIFTFLIALLKLLSNDHLSLPMLSSCRIYH